MHLDEQHHGTVLGMVGGRLTPLTGPGPVQRILMQYLGWCMAVHSARALRAPRPSSRSSVWQLLLAPGMTTAAWVRALQPRRSRTLSHNCAAPTTIACFVELPEL